MKKLLGLIGAINLSIVPTISTISCSIFGNNDKDDEEEKDNTDLGISQTEQNAVEDAIKSVDDTVILTKLEGGIDANAVLTTNSTFNDAIEFLQEEVQEIDPNASIASNVNDKLNDNLTIGNNTISVKFKKNDADKEQIINALITNVTNQEPRSNSILESLIKSLFEHGVNGKHLSVANDCEDVLSIINEKLDDVDDEINISLVDKHNSEKLKSGTNTIKIKFVDKVNNQTIFPVVIENVQSTGYIGKLKDQYPNSPIFEIADHIADAFGTQKLEKIYNLSGLDILKKAASTIKSTGHHIVDKLKYKQEYENSFDDDLNESREDAKQDKKKVGFLAKIKNKFKWSKKEDKLNNYYLANNEDDSMMFSIPTIDTNDNTSEVLKIKLQVKSATESDKEAQSLIKSILSTSLDGKALNTNDKMTAILPLIKSKINTISGLHQWHIEFKDKKIGNKYLNETNKVELKFSKSSSKTNFVLSLTVNQVKKVNSDLNLNLLPQRIDVDLWGITTSSTWEHLVKNLILSLKLNTDKYKVEIVSKKLKSKLTEQDNNKSINLKITPKKGKEKSTIISTTLFNIKQGKEKTTAFDKLYKKTQQISKKIGTKVDVLNKLINKNSNTSHPTTSKDKKPTTSKDKKPTTSKDKKPTTSKDKKPTTSKDKKPTTSKDKKPTTSKDKKPTTSKNKKPTTSKNKK